jgi:hypothetical protein
MNNDTSNFIISCTYCSDMSGIMMSRLIHNVPDNFYVGYCSNPECSNREQFVCRTCYDHSMDTGESSKGRQVGVYTTLSGAKRHIKKAIHTIWHAKILKKEVVRLILMMMNL